MTAYMPIAKRDDWSTPQKLFDEYNEIYNFDLDAAANQFNRKVEKYFGLDHQNVERRNGLTADWDGQRVWLNPPYGKGLINWLQKADLEAKNKVVVLLLPARTDTVWFHNYALRHKIIFLRGRLKYGDTKSPAPFPSMIVIMNP